jgi:SAM-dependent methyltransferase
MASAPPNIFSNKLRKVRRRKILRIKEPESAARFVLDEMIEDIAERLAFLRFEPENSLVIGDNSFRLAGLIGQQAIAEADIVGYFDHVEIDLEQPFPEHCTKYDFIACLGLLDTVNDLPGALVHIRNALSPGGLAIASFLGAGSLPMLRQIMLSADGVRPAARIHPMVDVRAGAQLLQRAGWADPVVDSHAIKVSYSSLQRLVRDLREQGLTSTLSSRAPYVGKAGLARAEQAFADLAGKDGRVTETFEIVTLTGRRPKARF